MQVIVDLIQDRRSIIMTSTKHKHLSSIDRINIEEALTNNIRLKDIAELIQKDPTTISKEIKRNRVELLPSSFNQNIGYIDRLKPCPILNRFPHVCNGCNKKKSCRLIKQYYRAADAHNEYLYTLSDSRKGYDITMEEVNNLSNIIKPLLEKGHSFYHIKINNPDIKYSLNTLYNYTNDGLFEFRNIDLPRKIRYKLRKKKVNKLPREAKKGRYYEDYIQYCHDNDITNTVQIDTVEGLKTDKVCLMTILFLPSRLMLIRKLLKQTAHNVTSSLNSLNKALGIEDYKKLFDVILTDNGAEFEDILGVEFCPETGEKRSSLFYCDPMRSNQKGAIEKNHEFIRMILPKKTSFEKITDEQVKLMETNINNYRRKSLEERTPYEVFEFSYGALICRKLPLEEMSPNEVILNPSLLK